MTAPPAPPAPPRFLVLGAGAIGGYFGGRLAETRSDVTFLVRPRRQEQLLRDGLQILSPLGDLTMPVKTVLAASLEPGFDFVLLTCKAYDLDDAMDAIEPAMNGRCAIVPLLNGMAHIERLEERFGSHSVMGGTCMIDVTLGADGVIRHNGTLQRIVFGERDGCRSPRSEFLSNRFRKTKIEWQRADNIDQWLWDKVVFLSALAATTTLFRANVREIMSAPGGPEAMERAMATDLEIAKREGHECNAAATAWLRQRLTDVNGNWSASLMRGLEAGGRIEGDHIVGWMLERARKHQLDDTILSLAYTAMKAYETRRERA